MDDPAKEWGLPDWRDEAAYTKKLSMVRWRWEFTRRQPAYREATQACYDAHEVWYAADQERRRINTRASLEYSHELGNIRDDAYRRVFERWGFTEALDPRVSDYPDEQLKIWPRSGISWRLGAGEGQRVRGPKDGELMVCLKLDYPLARQIERLREIARREQKNRKGALSKIKNETQNWPMYLRLLDAHFVLKEQGSRKIFSQMYDIVPQSKRNDEDVKSLYRSAVKVRDKIEL